jgi:hypothetical protein
LLTTDETYHISNIIKHYAHAREKHPYFCDRITCLSSVGADTHLDIYRSLLEAEIKASDVEARTVLDCEIYEALQAYTHGDISQAIEELYDCAAVVLRMIDVMKGNQKLGKPETKGVAE